MRITARHSRPSTLKQEQQRRKGALQSLQYVWFCAVWGSSCHSQLLPALELFPCSGPQPIMQGERETIPLTDQKSYVGSPHKPKTCTRHVGIAAPVAQKTQWLCGRAMLPTFHDGRFGLIPLRDTPPSPRPFPSFSASTETSN